MTRATPAPRASRAFRGRKATPERRARRATPAHKAPRAFPALRASRALPEHPAASTVPTSRRIKAAAPTFVLSAECVPPPSEGDVCDDGDDGTYDDRIRNGVCAGLPIPDCDDGDPNTIDTFEGGVCVHTPINPPSPEACNALDDDQDGLIDEGLGYDVPNGVVVCAGGVETVVCNSGFADTGGAPSTGCEVNVMTDPANCGALGNGVPTVPNATVAFRVACRH